MKTKRFRRRLELTPLNTLILNKAYHQSPNSNDPVQISLVDPIRLCCSVNQRKIGAKYFPCVTISAQTDPSGNTGRRKEYVNILFPQYRNSDGMCWEHLTATITAVTEPYKNTSSQMYINSKMFSIRFSQMCNVHSNGPIRCHMM